LRGENAQLCLSSADAFYVEPGVDRNPAASEREPALSVSQTIAATAARNDFGISAACRAFSICKEKYMLFGTHIIRTLYLHPLCRKIFILWLCFLAAVLLVTPRVTAQSCSITPSFQAVKAGDCVQFTANGCSDWTLNG